ncbi:LysR family transcriptional regulator [Bradyrhizobium sp. G127]|uniref:LysR family transcriptional regulator n=1 Tax=Bradyrhizobium sp. G127 TaxID=2904800 RepID=UPI001F37C516|nr:LysR family transcriptional regulator [Bradyrhizobium sp. G127]MCF2521982.1 LysR family transcriptional regulator [Bradyrhizobium sp. G127]
MHVDLVDLRLFVAIAEARSITHGAERSALALASASARIKGMEAALGVALLERQRRGVRLTAAGESLLDHARIVLHQVATMQGELTAFARGLKARIHMLANTSGATEHLPKALSSFLAKYPAISVDVEERESVEIATALASGAADIGIAVDAVLPDSLDRFPFCEDRLVLIVPPHDDIGHRRQAAFRDIAERDFVGLTEDSALQRHIATHAAKLGRRLRMRARLKSFDAICQMVEAGVGVAVIPEVAARRYSRSSRIRALRMTDPWSSRKLSICMRGPLSLPRPVQQLADHLKTFAKV